MGYFLAQLRCCRLEMTLTFLQEIEMRPVALCAFFGGHSISEFGLNDAMALYLAVEIVSHVPH